MPDEKSSRAPFEFTASAGSVRHVSRRVGRCRPGCYTRCYTTCAKSLRPERWAHKAALRSGIELDGVSEPHTQLGRILDDLINNALTYTIRTPHVQIALSTDSRRAIVRVEDTGGGIPEHEREQVFDRLYRVADPQVVVPGIGLGLYISRQLAESSGGSLVIESSTPGEGTVFALALPLSRTTSAA
jgi:signal transduction histidine kinase